MLLQLYILFVLFLLSLKLLIENLPHFIHFFKYEDALALRGGLRLANKQDWWRGIFLVDQCVFLNLGLMLCQLLLIKIVNVKEIGRVEPCEWKKVIVTFAGELLPEATEVNPEGVFP